METKEKNGSSIFNKTYLDNTENRIRQNFSAIKIKNIENNTLFRNDINTEKIKNRKRFDFTHKKSENNKEYFINNNLYKNETIQNLLRLKIEQNILEAIYNHKNLLIRNMKQKDRHGDGLIPKFEFLSIFCNTNCHYRLRIELIEKIINIYLNNDSNIIMVNYLNLINVLCQDIKNIIENKKLFLSINNYPNINYNSLDSKYRYSRNNKNFFSVPNSLLNSFQDLPKINEFNIKDVVNKINNVSFQMNNLLGNNISSSELQTILQQKNIYLSKEQINNLLKFLEIKDPNSFYFDEFIEKVKLNSSNLYITQHRSFNMNSIKKVEENERYNKTINSGFLTNKNKKLFNLKNNSESKKFTININNSNNNIKLYQSLNKDINNNKENNQKEEVKQNIVDEIIEENLKNHEIVIKCIQKIQNKIYEYQYKIDLISEYFDVLLSYDIFRLENVISFEEFEKVLSLEKFNFSKKEINLLFSFIDNKKDGLIDRIEFIEAIKNVPFPISIIQNYILANNLSIIDLAYKMEIDLYFTPLNDIFETKFNLRQFQNKIKLVNPNFNLDFSYALFKAINKESKEITIKKIFEVFNIKKDNSFKDLYIKRNEISERCIQSIFNNITYFQLREKFYCLDKYLTGNIALSTLIKTIKEILKEKIKESDLLHFLRMNRLIDKENIVNYRDFLFLIYSSGDYTNQIWYKCLEILMKFLKEECGNDLYIFMVKLNNVNNNLGMKQNIEENKLYAFFKSRYNFVTFPNYIIKKFDYDKDGKITEEDLKNIIINYVDKNFFSDKNKIEEEIHKSEKNKLLNEVNKFFIYIKHFLIKNNINLIKFFNYLDENKDSYVDKNEFIYQLISLPNYDKQKFSQDKIEQFFDYLDELKTGKIDFNIFENKFKALENNIKLNKGNIPKGTIKIEKIILNELSKYYLENIDLSDNQLFTLLDKDHDGIISKDDLKYFCVDILKINENELTFEQLLNFITSISDNKEENLNLSDIQKLMKDIRNNDLNKYLRNLNNFCNESINMKNSDEDWIKDIVDIIGMHISQEFNNNIQEFYNSLNLTNYLNKGQGLSFQNLAHFLETNYLLTESFHMNKDKYLVIFNYLSNGNKFITIDDLYKIFNNYDFYGWMHKYIKNFLIENFSTSLDAFKYFFKVKTKQNETPTSNEENKNKDFITKKEFFEGIINLFPNKFKINTISNYYNKIIKKNNEDKEKNIIKFIEFTAIFFANNNLDKKSKISLNIELKNRTMKIKNRNSFLSTIKNPFKVKINSKLKTLYDSDPFNKIKKLIKSSKNDFKEEFYKLMNKTDGKANIFQIKNMIRNLGLGLTNLEIEDIMHKSGLLYEGYINLIEFYKFITSENKTSIIYKKNIVEAMKDLKQLIIKYYTNPRLAFEMNDLSNKKIMDLDTFKKIVIDIYKREDRSLPPPPYSLIKSMYDYIDIRKDSLIDINEWNKTFCEFEGKLDYENDKNNSLKKWEMTNNIFEIYKLIARNNKIIKEKVKEHSITGECTIIHADNLIKVLKEVLPKVYLSHTQWRMIASLGEEVSLGLVNYDKFIKIVELSSKLTKSHMKI